MWKREWFPRISKYPANYWESPENQRAFLEKIASDYGLKNPNDWNRVTISLIKQRGGKVPIFL